MHAEFIVGSLFYFVVYSDGPENEKDLETEQLAKEYDIKHFARMVRKAKREKRDADSAPIQGKTPPVNTRRQVRALIRHLS